MLINIRERGKGKDREREREREQRKFTFSFLNVCPALPFVHVRCTGFPTWLILLSLPVGLNLQPPCVP